MQRDDNAIRPQCQVGNGSTGERSLNACAGFGAGPISVHFMRIPAHGRLLIVLLASVLLCLPALGAKTTALDRYIAKPDTNYSYKLVNTIRGEGHTAYLLEMHSQAWLTTNEVN